MRALLFTGPGGAGSSTMAAAAAVRSATEGRRTALLCRRAPRVAGLPAVAGLDVVTVDAQQAFEAVWRDRAAGLGALLPGFGLPPASSVVPVPGMAELALLAELARLDADPAVEVAVVDAGPLDAVAGLLGLPGTLRWWLDQALPPRLRALGAVRTAAVRAGTMRPGPLDAALAAVPVVERLARLTALTDAARTTVCLVATARPGAAAEIRAAATALALYGQRPAAVLARVLPAPGTGEWWARRDAEQEAVLGQLAEVAEVLRVPESATAPADLAALAPLLPDGELPAPEPLPVPAAERLAHGWRLALPLPFAERGAVELTRWGDDLVITADGIRRSLRLDALLRRCRVTGGRLADAGTAKARLEVSFVPDPALWPADLLGSHESGAHRDPA